MKKILLFILFVIAGCKVNESPEAKKIISKIDGLEAPVARIFTNSEIDIARRICTNTKKKREFFETLYNMREKFSFNLVIKTCEGTTPYHDANFVAVIANTNATFPEYIANQEIYFRDIVTDQSNGLKQLCDVVFSNGSIKNTFTYSNYVLSYVLEENNGLDHVEISKQIKNSQNNWTLAGIETIDFINSLKQAPEKFFGVEKERTLRQTCEGNKFSLVKETWLGALTNF